MAQLMYGARLRLLECCRGAGSVSLPDALDSKYLSAAWDWSWQWVFPAARTSMDPASGRRGRRHLHESVVQREFTIAVRVSGLTKPATCHTLRHSFATHLLFLSQNRQEVYA